MQNSGPGAVHFLLPAEEIAAIPCPDGPFLAKKACCSQKIVHIGFGETNGVRKPEICKPVAFYKEVTGNVWRSVQAAGEKPEFQVAPNSTQAMGEKSPHEGCQLLKVSVVLRRGEGIVVVIDQNYDPPLVMTVQGACQDTQGMLERETVGTAVNEPFELLFVAITDPFAFDKVLVARNNVADLSLYRLQGVIKGLPLDLPGRVDKFMGVFQ